LEEPTCCPPSAFFFNFALEIGTSIMYADNSRERGRVKVRKKERSSIKEWHDLISRMDVFSGLSAKEREAFLSQAQEKEIKRKDVLISARSPASHLYVITAGAIKMVRSGNHGQSLLVDFLKTGDILGEESMLLSGEYELNAVPFDSVTVLCIPADNIRRILDGQPRLGRALSALCLSRARSYRERLYEMTAVPVPVRLARALHMLARRFGKRDRRGTMIALRVTHQDLADYIGAARETVTLFLSQFKKDGLITMNVRKIIVPDLKALKKVAR